MLGSGQWLVNNLRTTGAIIPFNQLCIGLSTFIMPSGREEEANHS
jgi:hypothetical protein